MLCPGKQIVIFWRIRCSCHRLWENTLKTTLKELTKKYLFNVTKCGHIIDRDFPFLAVSPDGLIDDGEDLVEVKMSIYLSKWNMRWNHRKETRWFFSYTWSEGQLILSLTTTSPKSKWKFISDNCLSWADAHSS